MNSLDIRYLNGTETVGITKLGKKWVRAGTPRGKTARKLEVFAGAVLIVALIFGAMMLIDGLGIAQGALLGDVNRVYVSIHDLVIDFSLGSVVGVELEPNFGDTCNS
ncbi:MAG: hypothetical protein NUW37_02520 [Planctomycetes bacterium]|nr:hypothetical protein [Planctomycetota bacterium]